MVNEVWLDRIPITFLFILTVGLVLGAITVGIRLGALRKKRLGNEPEGPVSSVAGAVLALLAFILAFTFSIASGRYDTRKQLLLDEANAIRTAALRADLLPEPHRTRCRDLIKKYVDVRLTLIRESRDVEKVLAESEAAHQELWSHAIALAKADMNSDIGALFVESLNQVIEVHVSRRTVALQYRVPPRVWTGLVILTLLSMGIVGYQFGLSGRGDLLVNFTMAVTFAIVFDLIVRLDRPTGGMMVDPQPMIQLREVLGQAGSPAGRLPS